MWDADPDMLFYVEDAPEPEAKPKEAEGGKLARKRRLEKKNLVQVHKVIEEFGADI
jgi:hypothetical protein